MSRATRAEIRLQNLQHNLQVSRSTTQAMQMAIIKANGYGHGIVEVARALRDADAFGVATLDEGITLREAGIYKPILLLEGIQRDADLLFVHAYDLQCVVHHQHQVDLIEKSSKPVTVWLKMDTGMHRLGFTPKTFNDAYNALSSTLQVQLPIRLMTHLACADDKHSAITMQQIDLFDEYCEPYPANEKSIANSAGILGWPQSYRDWVRPGIMLYGVSPFVTGIGEDFGLKPVMTLYSELIAINQLKKGDAIGYGGSYVCERDMPVGVAAIGYGDGYPRHAPVGTPVLINGKRVPLIGRVSMDMITLDLSDCPNTNVGDEVVLWGEGLPVEIIAQHADTIGYELLCGVTRRVRMEYL